MATQRSASDSMTRSGMTGPSVSLAQLRAGNVRIEWFEAVAVVAALCQSIAETSDERRGVTADNVFLFENGAVAALVAVQAPGEVVRQVAALLSELLPDFHRRVSFHELLTTASASPPGYKSLDELSRALAPFERPGREGIIRELYHRGVATVQSAEPVYTASFEPAALDRFVSERTLRPDASAVRPPQFGGAPMGAPGAGASQPRKAPPRPGPFWQDQRVQAALIVVVALVVIGVCGWLLWTMWFRPPSTMITTAAEPGQTPALSQEALPPSSLDTTQTATLQRGDVDLPPEPSADAPGQDSTRVGSMPLAGAATGAGATAGAPSAARQPSVNARATTAAPAPRSRPTVTVAPSAPQASAAVAPAPAPRADAGVPPAPPATAGSSQPAFIRADDASRIYTVEDREVTPPFLTASQQLWRIPASQRPEDSMRVEVVVDEDGNVVSVRSVDPPSSLADTTAVAMSLSAAKSWHFRPAVKDGRPVRYRQIVSVSMR